MTPAETVDLRHAQATHHVKAWDTEDCIAIGATVMLRAARAYLVEDADRQA